MGQHAYRLWLYPGANPASDATNWGLESDVTAYVRRPGQDGGAPVRYSWGKQDESTNTDAGQMTLTLDNRDGRFSTDNITGPWYGSLDLNTPIRLAVDGFTDSFTRTTSNAWGTADASKGWSWAVGGTASQWGTDGSKATIKFPTVNTAFSAIATNGNSRDCDVTATVIPLATATGASYGAGPMVRYTDGNNTVFTSVEFNTGGTVTIKIRQAVAGVQTELASVNPIASLSYSANDLWKIRVQADGGTIRAKTWLSTGSEPSAWHISATPSSSLTGTGVGMYLARFLGNTNSGTANLIGVDDFTVLGLEWTGYVVSWPLRWDITGNNSWAPITAAGILRRLRQGSNPVQSPLRRQLGTTADVTGYWPMEEGSDAKYFLSASSARQGAASFSAVTPAGDTSLAGGGPAPVLSADTGIIQGQTGKANNGTGFAAMFFVKLPSLPSSKTRIARFRCSRGPVPIWDLSIDGTSTYVEGLNATGTVVTSATNTIAAGVNFAKWVAWQLETDNSGASTAWAATYHQVSETDYFSQTGTVAGTTNSNVASFALTGASGTAFAHVWLGRNTLPFVTDSFSLVSSGYAGELAADRFARVCGEAGIPYAVQAGSSERMGAQKESTTLAVLQSCADADYGVIAERGAGLEFIPREARWNATTKMALSVAAGQIGGVPEPTRDDQRLRNKVTVSRTGGGSGVAQDDTSIARNGTWEDSITLNVFDDSVLESHAAWRVAIGTGSRLRWPVTPINLTRNPSLAVYWRQRAYGWRLGITTGLAQVKGNEPDLIMEGFQAELEPDSWTIDMNCTDAGLWTAAVADDTGILGRVDSEYCTTTALISATATSIPVTTTTGKPKWDNTASLWSGGVDLNIGGERVTVTAVANGAGQAQTFTASARGVNGYAASHASGTAVSLWDPAIVAL